MKLAKRMDRILIETAFEVLVRARALEAQGRSIIHLEIGEPDFDTPKHIVEAAKQALDQGWTHYGPTQGYPELREAVASSHVRSTRKIRIGPEQRLHRPGRQAHYLLSHAGVDRTRRRGDLPQPRLSHLRIDGPLPRRRAGAHAAGRRSRLLLRSRHPEIEAHR